MVLCHPYKRGPTFFAFIDFRLKTNLLFILPGKLQKHFKWTQIGLI